MDFCKCGSIKMNGKCSNEHCPSKSLKLKDWVIGGKAMDFKKPVSYKVAVKYAKKLSNNENDPNKERFSYDDK